jgi:hypothetical protein
LRQDYEGARVALRKAYALNPRADTTLRLGIAELQSGHPVEAVEHLREYLKHTEEPETKLDLVRTKWLPRAKASTARVDVFAAPGTEVLLDGTVQEAPAVSTLDEFRPGGPTLSIVVSAGEHDVSAHLGTSTETQHVVVRGGEIAEVHLQRLPDASPSPPASVRATAIAPEDTGTPRADPRSRARWITVVTLGSAALAATGVAAGFSIAFEQNASDARALRQAIGSPASAGCQPPSPAAQCPQLGAIDDAEERNGALATSFYIAGGAAAALAAATWVLWPQSHSNGRPRHHGVRIERRLVAHGKHERDATKAGRITRHGTAF